MASREAFAVACIELYGRIWAELEVLFEADERDACVPCGYFERIEIVRLEIQLLIDACKRPRWQILLNASQRATLKSTLQAVLLALDSEPKQISREAIAAAQNRLFDAVREYRALYRCVPELNRLALVADA